MNEREMWAAFAVAYRNIERGIGGRSELGSLIGSHHSDGKDSARKEALVELEDAFRHMHVKRDGDDICAKCGLDLRNGIHHEDVK